DIPNGDRSKSFAFVNVTGNQNYQNTVFAMTVGNVNETFRRGKKGTRTTGSTLWIQHRSNGLQKLYPHVMQDHTAKAGEKIEADYTMYAGQVDYASTLLV